MLNQQTVRKLNEMKLHGMGKGFEEQLANAVTQGLAFEERFGILVDQEQTYRENQRLKRLLKSAKLKGCLRGRHRLHLPSRLGQKPDGGAEYIRLD
jgi:IstB-like ATP binding protein